MKRDKATDLSGVVAEMLQVVGILVHYGYNICVMTLRRNFKKGCIPVNWQMSVMLPIYKGKGDNTEGSSCWNTVLAIRIRQQAKIDEMQFGFVEGKGSTDVIFVVRQMHEKFRANGTKLYFKFVDLEKAFYRVPREMIR